MYSFSKSRFIKNFFQLFIIITVIMVLSNSIVLLYVFTGYRKQMQKDDLVYLNSIAQRMDVDLDKSIAKLSKTMMSTDYYNRYIRLDSNIKDKNIRYLNLMETLNIMHDSYDDVYRDIAVYYIKSQELISGTKGYFQLSRSANQDFCLLYDTDNITDNYNVIFASSNADSDVAATITYKFSENAAMIFLLDNAYFDRLFFKDFYDEDNSSGIIILDANMNPIYSRGTLPDYENMDYLTDLASSSQIKDENGNHFLSTTLELDTLNIKLIKFEHGGSLSVLYNNSELLIIFLLFTLISAGSAFGSTCLFSKKIYTPVKKIVNDITEVPAEKTIDEFAIINQYMENSKIRISEMEGMLSSNRMLLKEKFIKYLLTNPKPDTTNISEYLRILKIDLPYPHFYAISCFIRTEKEQSFSYTDLNLLLMQFIRQLEDNCTNNGTVLIGGEYSDNHLGLVLNAQDIKSANQTIESILSVAGEYFHNNDDIPFFITIGTAVNSVLMLSDSFALTNRNLGYHFFIKPDAQRFFNIRTTSINSNATPLNILSKTMTQSATDAEAAFVLLEQAYTAFSQGLYELETSQRVFTEVTQYFQQVLKTTQAILSDKESEQFANPNRAFWNVFDYIIFVKNILHRFADSPVVEKGTLEEKISIYVEKNLEKDLSLDTLADIFNLHPKYLSKVYKERTQKNLTTYINEKRIEKAILYLTTTEMTIDEISSAVGFSSSGYFIRKFKEIVGTTPKSYREK